MLNNYHYLMNPITSSAFWQFSLSIYQHNLVQSTLLDWQNQFNANVNLALLCAMLNKQHVYLTQQQLLILQQAVEHFSLQFTKPLRALRCAYKEKQANVNKYSQLRQKLLDAELLLEQQEQRILINELTTLKVCSSEGSSSVLTTTSSAEQVTDNLALYQSLLIKINGAQSKLIKPELTKLKGKLTDLNQYLF